MKCCTAIRRPVLAPHARLRWDTVREQHQIVYPEAALVLNETGAAILRLCDGREIEAIIAELAGASPEAEVERDVIGFLQNLADEGLLRDAGAR